MRRASIFGPLRRSELASRSAAIPGASWWTWAPQFRRAIAALRVAVPRTRPRLLHLSRAAEYAYTYSVPRALARSTAVESIRPFVHDLLRVNPDTNVRFLTGLSCEAEGWSLRELFALIRAVACEETGDSSSALYAPLSATGAREGDFPLHADLYRPTILLNVFERPASDGTGRSIFLPTQQLFVAAERCRRVSRRTRMRMKELLTRSLELDGFEELYDLLHGDHAWCEPLAAELARQQLALGLGRYEGYLLHDRRWLHGREAPRGGVPTNRVHRLVYAPATARAEE